MAYSKEIIEMSDGNKNVFHSWIPEKEIKGCILVSHGMCEHALRYAELAKFMNEEGFALFAEDHRGHGETAKLQKENGGVGLGYLAEKNGFFRVTDDILEEAKLVKKRNPEKKLFLLGHSFGSFIAQNFMEKYPAAVDGVILCGSKGPSKIIGFGKFVSSTVCALGGSKKPSNLMTKMSFAFYNKTYPCVRTKSDWLTRDADYVDSYLKDPLCNFKCTGSFFKDLMQGLGTIHKKKNLKAIPKKLPVFLIVGDDDPVGGYSKSVKKLHEIYIKNGMSDTELKIYPKARHELFHETNRDEVMKDTLSWLKKHL